MRDAAVGFHCPDCIAEGQKQTRQARTPYGGLRASRQGVVSISLIVLNAAVWVLIMASGGGSSRLVDYLELRPKGVCAVGPQAYDVSQAQCSAGAGTWLPGLSDGAWWQPLTSMFAHVAVLHIGFNMLALWVLGPQLEMVLGRVRYLGLYLLSGLVGSAAVYLFSAAYTPSLGASGAIFGLMAALLVIAYKARADVSQLLVWVGINAVFTFVGANISWQAHVGGFVGGAVLAAVLAYAPRERRTTWQAAGFACVAVLVAVAFVMRTAAVT